MRISWDEFDTYCMKLSQQIRQSGKKLKYIVGVERGGLCLAVTLSHKLCLQYCDIETAAFFPPEEVLVVDDINDTGNTLSGLVQKGYSTAVLLTRYSSPLLTTFSGGMVMDDAWVIFPWEGTYEDTLTDIIKNKYQVEVRKINKCK